MSEAAEISGDGLMALRPNLSVSRRMAPELTSHSLGTVPERATGARPRCAARARLRGPHSRQAAARRHRGATVDIARLIKELAESVGFRLQNRDQREPPPGAAISRRPVLTAPPSTLKCARKTVLTFELAA